MKQLWNPNKVGTLIISYYRSGTHFLHDTIDDQCPFETIMRGEICNDNSIQQLIELTNNDMPYKICILNNTTPKFYLTSADELLSKWHVVHLTRKNKLNHFMSHWFWFQNTLDQQKSDSGNFLHHATKNSVYRQHLNEVKKSVSVDFVIQWLMEQLINYHIKADVSIDYDELIDYQSEDIAWAPNQYENIQLEDIIVNYQEIKNLLLDFDLANRN
jgi:hypothetical protein